MKTEDDSTPRFSSVASPSTLIPALSDSISNKVNCCQVCFFFFLTLTVFLCTALKPD